MKKFAFALVLLSGAFGSLSLISAQSACSQVVQAAVNYRGECSYFSNPCQVPKDWKKVSSCDLIESDTGISLKKKLTQRRSTFFRTRPAENAQLASKTYTGSYRGYGSGSLTRGNVNRSGDLTKRNTRKFTSRSGRSTRNTKTSGIVHSTNSDNGTYKRMARATGLKRTGALEDNVKWGAQQARHSKRVPTSTERPWYSAEQLNVKEILDKKRAKRQAYIDSLETTDGMNELRRGGYRDSRVGNLENYTERETE